jgi:hypothetical protein
MSLMPLRLARPQQVQMTQRKQHAITKILFLCDKIDRQFSDPAKLDHLFGKKCLV